MLEAVRAASQSVRYLNELRALDVLFREGAMSRADLARALGLNRSTTGSIVNTLIANPWSLSGPSKRMASLARKRVVPASTSSSIRAARSS